MALLRSLLVLCFLVFYLQPSHQAPEPRRKFKRSTHNHTNRNALTRRPNDYELFPGIGCYKFHPEEKSVLEGMTICSQEGGHLMVVNSHAEANVVKTIYAKYPEVWEWANIGFSDLNGDGHYETIFGDSLENAGYNIWASGEPDSSRPSCGVINRRGHLGGGTCSNRNRPFFCEYDSSRCE